MRRVAALTLQDCNQPVQNLPQLLPKTTSADFAQNIRIALTREDRMNLKFAFIATPRVLRVRASASGYPLG